MDDDESLLILATLEGADQTQVFPVHALRLVVELPVVEGVSVGIVQEGMAVELLRDGLEWNRYRRGEVVAACMR
jgi:hypothetical protein